MLSMLQRALLASAGGAYPKVEWVGGATSQNENNHQWSFSNGDIAGVLPGDLLILQVFGQAEQLGGNPRPAQSGWTTVFEDSAFDAGVGLAFLYHRTVGLDGSIAFNGLNSTISGAALLCFRNAQFVSYSNSTTNTPVTPNITMDRGDMSLALYYAAGEDVWTNSSAPISGYADWAQYANRWGTMSRVSKGAACFREIKSDGTATGGSWGGTIPAANFMRCTNVRLSPLEA